MLKLGLAISSLVILLTAGSLGYSTYYLRELSRLQDVSNRLPIIDEEIYFKVMLIHSGIINHFDGLVQLEKTHGLGINIFTKSYKKLIGEASNEQIETLLVITKEKKQQLERFKSDASLLRNARAYTIKALQDLIVQLNHSPAVNTIMQHLMFFAEAPTEQKAQTIQQLVQQLDTSALNEAENKKWGFSQRHIDYYLTKKNHTMNAEPLTINWLNTDAFVYLQENINRHKKRYENFQTLSFNILIVAAVILCLVAGFTLRNLLRSQRELRQLNKTLEEKIEHAIIDIKKSRDEAIAANAEKTNFLANMSHELRTPLNSIIGFSARLKKKLNQQTISEDDIENKTTKPNAANIRAVDSIYKNGKYLLSFFNDLLQLSKINDNQNDLQISTVNVNKICEGLIAEMRSYFAQETPTLTLESTQEYCQLNSDSTLVQQILYSILNVAIRHNSEGTVSINTRENKDGCDICIRDTGKPLSQTQIAILFDPFAYDELDEEIRVESKGLGLMLTKRLIEILGGDLHIEAESQGNCYHTRLPHIVMSDPAEKRQYIGAG